jgi:hypothetical protein
MKSLYQNGSHISYKAPKPPSPVWNEAWGCVYAAGPSGPPPAGEPPGGIPLAGGSGVTAEVALPWRCRKNAGQDNLRAADTAHCDVRLDRVLSDVPSPLPQSQQWPRPTTYVSGREPP